MRPCAALLFAISASCGGAAASDAQFVDDLDLVPWGQRETADADDNPSFHASSYHLKWRGVRIGEAREVFHRTDGGVRIVRTERIHITRGGVPVESTSEITIDADENLRATRVELQARAGAVERSGHAVRADDGSWILALDGEAIRRAPKNALPIELVPFSPHEMDPGSSTDRSSSRASGSRSVTCACNTAAIAAASYSTPTGVRSRRGSA